jgi:diadenosine tetraphosphate (Ap4A) HIT family hydrolase
MFVLHDRLAADTAPVRALTLCEALLMDNRAWPWLILVPRRPGLREVHHLPAEERALLVEEVALASRVAERLYAPDKLNVAAIGNVVPQLHVHVVARRVGDPAWPNPVWGSGLGGRYDPAARAAEVERLRAAFEAESV